MVTPVPCYWLFWHERPQKLCSKAKEIHNKKTKKKLLHDTRARKLRKNPWKMSSSCFLRFKCAVMGQLFTHIIESSAESIPLLSWKNICIIAHQNSHQPITVSHFQLTKVITRWQRRHQIAASKVLVHIHLNRPFSGTTFSANVISSVIGWKLKPLAFKSERLQTHPPLQPLQCHFPPCYIKGVPCTFL